jgi:quercetin dioxygenase-like cupin family protein
MKLLPSDGPAPRPDRPATLLLHDEPNVRVLAFHLAPGQEVPPHASDSTVVVHVIDGVGIFHGEDGEERIGAGGTAVYAPGERHSMAAVGGPLRFLAVLSPGPA